MGLPLTEEAEVDCPCCEEPLTVTGCAAVESVADFLVALAYDRTGADDEEEVLVVVVSGVDEVVCPLG